MNIEDRHQVAAVLRAVADLTEAGEDTPLSRADISYHVHGDDAAATVTAIASALPCEWHASISRSGSHEWLDLQSDLGGHLACGVRVSISADAAGTCTQAGTRTVTVWEPQPAIAALLGGKPLSGLAEGAS
jgi:hypothetical protein